MKDVDRRFDDELASRTGRLEIRRSRGAASGFLLVLVGLWGALVPFVGPYFNFAYDPDTAGTWTAARGWLEVLPGAATVVGGLLLMMSRNRATAMLGGWITVLSGAWFVVGRVFAGPWRLGDVGAPVADTESGRIALELTFFSGLGLVIVFLGAIALGRLSVRSLRDVRHAQRPLVEPAEPTAFGTTTTEPVTEPERRRNWRHLFGGSRRTPVAH